jgi:hypothetical protein
MEFNSSLNKFGNLRDNEYRELINDEFNDARTQVIARQFGQTKQFLETFERERSGDRLVNLEVAKAVSNFTNAISKSINGIDNNDKNTEEGIIVGFRRVVNMIDAYINASGTRPRDIERYKKMLFDALPQLNTYFEKAAQVEKMGVINPRELEKVQEIIDRLETGYATGQTIEGQNLASQIKYMSLDEELGSLRKDLTTQAQILLKLKDEDTGSIRQLVPAINKLIGRVQPILDLLSPGKVDFKEIAHLYGEAIETTKGRRTKEQIQKRETIIKSFIGDLRTLLYEARDLVGKASSAPATDSSVLPASSGQISGLNPAMSGFYQPSSGSVPSPSAPEAPIVSPEIEASKANLRTIVEQYIGLRKSAEKASGADKVKLEAERDEKQAEAEKQVEKLRTLGLKDDEIARFIDSVEFDLFGSGRRRGGVKKGVDNINTLRLRSKNLRGEYAVARQFDEPSMNFKPLYKDFGKRVDRGTEGAGKPKMRSKKRIILFEEI